MSYVINTEEMRAATKLTHEVAEHFDEKRKGLDRFRQIFPAR